MVEECKNVGLREPGFSSVDYLVTTVFYRDDESVLVLDKLQDKMLKLLGEHPCITVRELMALLQVSERTVYYNLKRLAEEGLIVHIGARKNGHWQVVEKDK